MFIIHDLSAVPTTYALIADKREENSLLVSRGAGLYRQGLKHQFKIMTRRVEYPYAGPFLH